MAVWDYSEASARYIFGDSTRNRAADRIMDALRSGELDRTGISNLFHHHAKSDQIDKALDLLEKEGKAAVEYRDTEGRPVAVWNSV